MIKLLIAMFALFLLTPVEQTTQEFLDTVDKAYEIYTLETSSNSEYQVVIVKGVVDGKCTYGLAFTSHEAKKYSLGFEIDEKEYEAKANSRGDYTITAFDFKDYDAITVHVYNKSGKEMSTSWDNRLEKFSKDDLVDYNTGENKGTALTKLTLQSNGLFEYMLIFSGGIIVVCGIVMIYLFVNKKGFFSKQKRKEGVFDMKEYITKSLDDLDNNQDYVDDYLETVEIKAESLESAEVYSNHKKDEYQDLESIEEINISAYLISKGYTKKYPDMSTDEKNQVMLELMKLRDNKQITNNQYLEETYRLWKE